METIVDQIMACASEYKMSTGFSPARVYLGRVEMLALCAWAHGAGYKTEPTAWEGAESVIGLTPYQVDDDAPHMRCCA